MIQLTIIRIEGYGQWTLTLGSDREAQLQMLQARIYHDVQRLFSERDSIVFFNRFDEYFAITNGLGVDDHLHIQHELTKLYDNMLMSMTIGAGKTAFEANLNAYRTRKEGRMLDGNSRIFGSVQPQADVAQIMHIDIDSSAKVGNWLSPYELTALVMKIYSRLAEEFLKHDSLAFFLGGDNVMVISNGMSKEQADVVLKKVTAGNDIKLNCGIGIGKTGRRAAEAATKALDTIRDLREEGKIQTIYEIQCP
ncbi:MAG: GTP cyclohydrolase IIa [Nitrososphaeraceae archaeon]|jgi:GTP cyclohydrolase IIa|nr:gch3 [Nitrososphaera sp.]MDW0122146.1 GTP cyclohydrolase IIa [Nitrososphaeraceae archaeon]